LLAAINRKFTRIVRFPPQTLEFLFLQDAEQFGLQGGSDLADLVEEQSTLIR